MGTNAQASPSIVMPLSFFCKDQYDHAPRFVEGQILAFLRQDPGMKITVLVPHHGKTVSTVHREGFRVVRFHYFWPHRLEHLAGGGIIPSLRRSPWLFLQIPFLFLFEFIALLRFVRKEPCDYIYAHWFTPQGIVASLVSRLTGVPFGFTSHSSDVDVWRRFSWVGRLIVRRVVSRADAVTVVSRRSLAKLRRFFNAKDWRTIEPRVAVIPMGISMSDFNTTTFNQDVLKDRHGLPGKTVLLFIGRLVEKKGIDYLLRAMETIVDKHSNLHLVIAGEGQCRGELVEMVKQLALEQHVTFAGHVAGAQKTQHFAMADMVLVPSIVTATGDAEGLPVSLMEGLAAGKVCIATRASGADDIVTDGVDGLLIEEQSEDSIVAAVSRTLAMPESERLQMEHCARQLALSLDWSIIGARHVEHLFRGIKR